MVKFLKRSTLIIVISIVLCQCMTACSDKKNADKVKNNEAVKEVKTNKTPIYTGYEGEIILHHAS